MVYLGHKHWVGFIRPDVHPACIEQRTHRDEPTYISGTSYQTIFSPQQHDHDEYAYYKTEFPPAGRKPKIIDSQLYPGLVGFRCSLRQNGLVFLPLQDIWFLT